MTDPVLRYFPNRWWDRLVPRICRQYVAWDGTEELLRRVAPRHVPWRYRWWGASVSLSEIDASLGSNEQWVKFKSQVQPGDKVWPFAVNRFTLAMRAGFVLVRRGQVVDLVVLVVS